MWRRKVGRPRSACCVATVLETGRPAVVRISSAGSILGARREQYSPNPEAAVPYDPRLVAPMRAELTTIGFSELLTAVDVDSFMAEQEGTALLVINSVCGCAAGMARPGVRLALQQGPKPDRLGTVFAGQDLEAVARARSYFADYPPSSPSMALFRDGELVHFVPRHQIEGRLAQEVASDLARALAEHCATTA